MDNKKIRELIEKIDDLIIQATKEKSHYYTANVLKECKRAISQFQTFNKKREQFWKDNFISQGKEYDKFIDKERIKEVIKNSIDWSVLFSVWCNHYKTKKEYDRLREKDLDGFAEHYTKALMRYFEGKWKPYDGSGK